MRASAPAPQSDAVFGKENTGINFDAYEDIPVETSGHDVPAHVDTFEELDLGEGLMANIRRCKYTKPTPVQKYAIPIGLGGRDMMACAQTGSGKTAAFCFPIIAGLLKSGYQPTGRQRKVCARGGVGGGCCRGLCRCRPSAAARADAAAVWEACGGARAPVPV
jgi:hypothetical protein